MNLRNRLILLGFIVFDVSSVIAIPLPLTSPVEHRQYDSNNPFSKIIKNPDMALKTPKYVDTPYSISFQDKKMRVKNHVLAIPKGPYISFPHFLDFASDKEIKDLMETVAKTAEMLGLDKTGYRIVTNHSLRPGSKDDQNDANQEVGHFHIHLVGGECLGKPVAGSYDHKVARESIDMTYDEPPFGSGLSAQEFIREAKMHKLDERRFKIDGGKECTILAYNIPGAKKLNLTDYVGFLMLDDQGNSLFTSIHDFAQHASVEQMRELFTFVKDISERDGSYETGFRLVSDFGGDAHQTPKDVFQMSLAGGNLLGFTAANVYGNHPMVQGPQGEKLDKTHFNYYKDLPNMPHDHCHS